MIFFGINFVQTLDIGQYISLETLLNHWLSLSVKFKRQHKTRVYITWQNGTELKDLKSHDMKTIIWTQHLDF